MQKDEQEFLYVLGRRIDMLFRENFQSQNAFAKAVECDERTIRRILRGEQNVSLLLIRKIARSLDMTIEEILINSKESRK